MAINIQGYLTNFDNQAEIRNEVSAIAINFFINRTPLVARIPKDPVGSVAFTVVNRNFRPRTTTLGAAVATTTATTITVADNSTFMQGDVLELATGERVEVSAPPLANGTDLTVIRGVEATTAAVQTTATLVRLIGNSRTGAEINQTATTFAPQTTLQYCQTFQHPVQIGGSLQSTSAFVLPPGATSPFDEFKMEALQNLMDDMETSSLYGIGQAASAATSRPKQKGLRTFMTTNKTTAPTNAAAYKPTDLIRDTLQPARANGGAPDLLLLSSDWMQGLATWGHAVQRLDAGENIFGTPIDLFEAPFLDGVRIMFTFHLRPGTAVCLTGSEVKLRMKRNWFWNPHGILGDAMEGDWIAEGAIELANQQHHAWVEGVTGFSAT